MYCKCCGQLFIVPVPMVTLRCITTPWQDWCTWGLRSAGETDSLPGCALWKLTKLEPNIQRTRLPMQRTGICALVVWRGALLIAYWNMNNRQTDMMKGQIFVSKQSWMTETSDVIKRTASCLCCAHLKFTFYQLTGRIKVLVSSSTDETKGDLNHSAQWCYQMKCTICVQAHQH